MQLGRHGKYVKAEFFGVLVEPEGRQHSAIRGTGKRKGGEC
jgi:hypothetical protein